jgi:hypothetical protein
MNRLLSSTAGTRRALTNKVLREMILLRPERVADEVIDGALDRGVIVPALGLQEPLCD